MIKKISVVVIAAVFIAFFVLSAVRIANTTESYDASSVHPVTKQELADFLISNSVHNRTYHEIGYNCVNFAVDLWYDAYLSGMDAFIIFIDKGMRGHALVGFRFNGVEGKIAGWDYWWYYMEPWGDDESYFIVEPEMIWTFPCNASLEIIMFISGEDALRLYEAKHGGSPLPIIKVELAKWKYKLEGLFG